MTKLAALVLASALLASLVCPAEAGVLRRLHKLERQQQREAARAERDARMEELETARDQSLAARVTKAKKARAIATRNGEIDDTSPDDFDLQYFHGDGYTPPEEE